ncbi:MAG: hypothetical protein J0I45_00080 [Bosea sp.]|nr:hypothetical protein [Bosea sp. (in: a-proteobacteria)]
MAKCAYCGRSGWLLSVNTLGVCKACSPVVALAIEGHRRVLIESERIVQTTSNTKTRISRLNTILDHCLALKANYADKGVRISSEIDPAIQSAREQLSEAIRGELMDIVSTARRKSEDAISDTSKLGAYNKAIESASSLDEYHHVGDDLVESVITALRNERDDLRFQLLTSKAEIEVSKKKPKKAIEIYIETIAMFESNSRFVSRLAAARQRIDALQGPSRELPSA